MTQYAPTHETIGEKLPIGSRKRIIGGDVENGNKYPVTGWYLEDFGAPPMPEPQNEVEREGARILAKDDFWEEFEFRPGDGDDDYLRDRDSNKPTDRQS